MQLYQMILKYQALKEKSENNRTASTVDINDVLKDLDNLDPFGSYIPEVPECVKDWYYEVQSDFYNSLDNLIRFCYRNTEIPICKWFINTEDAVKILINVHQFGFKVKKEKKYLVKLKGVANGTKALKHNIRADSWYMGVINESVDLKMFHTKEELIKAGFEEVFDNTMFEIDEVE